MATEPPDNGGGKISATKRRWGFNPYERPPPAALGNPHWLSCVVVPASRKIASGVAEILSSVFISYSSASGSSSDDDSYFENGCDGHPNGTNGLNLEAERKHAIKQLLLQETFSREECDMLVKIINSRVLEHSSGRRVLDVTPDHAVMEAKKFLEKKRAGRSPQSDFGLYSAVIQHTESQSGSPADMAKSYMRTRPPWASPSRQLTSEGKLHSVRKDSVTHLKERNYLASGAWNMHDEIRNVRSKATEDMVRPLSSSKGDLSLLSPLPRDSQDYGVTVAIPGDNINVLSPSVETKTVYKSAKLAAGADSNKGISESDIREETIIDASSDPEQKKDLKAKQNLSECDVSDHSVIPDRAGSNMSSRNVESGSQNSHEELSQEQTDTDGNNVVAVKSSNSKGAKQQDKKPVRRQPKRQKKS